MYTVVIDNETNKHIGALISSSNLLVGKINKSTSDISTYNETIKVVLDTIDVLMKYHKDNVIEDLSEDIFVRLKDTPLALYATHYAVNVKDLSISSCYYCDLNRQYYDNSSKHIFFYDKFDYIFFSDKEVKEHVLRVINYIITIVDHTITTSIECADVNEVWSVISLGTKIMEWSVTSPTDKDCSMFIQK